MAVISVEVPDRLSVGIQKDTVIDFDTLEEMMSIIARDEKLEGFDDPEFMSFLEKSIEKGRANIREGRYQVYDDTLKSNLITRLFDK